ncbi:MAG: glycosyltransferase family 4 protein [Bacteroidetes bacterium]|nr:glycosyltransferase family 4 protein [Bacteroidota bacterium]
MKNKVLSCVYAHFEAHGPGIYHNELLAKSTKNLDVYYSKVMETTWNFPSNVRLISDRNRIIPWERIYKMNIIKRWTLFFWYTFKMLILIRKNNYDLIVVFNPPALLSLSIISPFINGNTQLWYHNYDPIDASKHKKFSLGYFSYRAMARIFPKLTLFTHSEEKRDSFFPLKLLKSPRIILPNYSMLEMHSGVPRDLDANVVKIIFSGVISHGNGLEDLIKISKKKIGDYNIKLILKGFVIQEYKEGLESLIKETGTHEFVEFIGPGPWKEVPEILRRAHIGIHIFHKDDIISKTMGKGGSGKVFQYIAEGLPVLMSPGFKNNFLGHKWAVPTSLDHSDLIKNINYIVENYYDLSQAAIHSFKSELNCNSYFDDIFYNLNK